jgi:hypothetical protein
MPTDFKLDEEEEEMEVEEAVKTTPSSTPPHQQPKKDSKVTAAPQATTPTKQVAKPATKEAQKPLTKNVTAPVKQVSKPADKPKPSSQETAKQKPEEKAPVKVTPPPTAKPKEDKPVAAPAKPAPQEKAAESIDLRTAEDEEDEEDEEYEDEKPPSDPKSKEKKEETEEEDSSSDDSSDDEEEKKTAVPPKKRKTPETPAEEPKAPLAKTIPVPSDVENVVTHNYSKDGKLIPVRKVVMKDGVRWVGIDIFQKIGGSNFHKSKSKNRPGVGEQKVYAKIAGKTVIVYTPEEIEAIINAESGHSLNLRAAKGDIMEFIRAKEDDMNSDEPPVNPAPPTKPKPKQSHQKAPKSESQKRRKIGEEEDASELELDGFEARKRDTKSKSKTHSQHFRLPESIEAAFYPLLFTTRENRIAFIDNVHRYLENMYGT